MWSLGRRHTLVFALLLTLPLSGPSCVPQAKYLALQDQMEQARAENARLRSRVEALEAKNRLRAQAYQELLADLKPLIDRGVLKVQMEGGRVVIGMASDVLFGSGSAELSPEGRETVLALARGLAVHGKDKEFQVEGHTDNTPINTPQFPSNWHLGAARALTVAQLMVEAGFPAKHLSAASFGAERPVASNGTAEGRAQNRRIEVVLLPDLSDIPGFGEAPKTPSRDPKPAPTPRPRSPR